MAYGDPDPVDPVKAEIAYDDFAAMDMRVCKVLKCQEIRKSHSCYKLTLSDGLDKRTIVSSIKAYYTPEELVGKKIIVLANLKDHGRDERGNASGSDEQRLWVQGDFCG